MAGPAISILLTLAAAGVFAAAACTDLAERRIPNRLVLALAAIGIARIAADLGAGPGGLAGLLPALLDLGAAALVLALGAAVFHAGAVGGGDVKLLAAGALWLGTAALWPFLLVTALAGGLLAAAWLAAAAVRPGAVRAEAGLPYGVAIAVGGIVASLPPL